MFKGHPKGLYALALANTGERFGYYTMLAIFVLYLQAKFGYSINQTGSIYSAFIAITYVMPLVGGFIADRVGYGKMVKLGICVMFLGYLLLSIPMGIDVAKASMFTALGLIAIGTGFFKGNLQVIIGNLYDDPKYQQFRDNGFSLFYMAINIGSMLAPAAAIGVSNFFLKRAGFIYDVNASASDTAYMNALSNSYNLGFGVACFSLVFSMIIYLACQKWFVHADVNLKQAKEKKVTNVNVEELTPKQTRSRMTALFLVFAVVIVFWMSFQQSGLGLTLFAKDYTLDTASGLARIGFDVLSLVLLAIGVYAAFSTFQSERKTAKIISLIVWILTFGIVIVRYFGFPDIMSVRPEQFQQFNPFFIVVFTPFVMLMATESTKKGKGISAPRKIGYGMIMAAVAYLVMAIGSVDLSQRVSPNWLISTYFLLTIAELLLSPIGISFVTKVAPPKYKGIMMGCWYGVSAIGNYLTRVITGLWDKLPLWQVWSVLIVLCTIAAIFIFSIMRKLESVDGK